MQRFAVIGLGRFGSRLATNLAAEGAEVIAIDQDRGIVEELRDQVTLAIALDSTDEQALKIQGIDQVDCAVVGIGHNFEANALTTALLTSLGVKLVVARARNKEQADILRAIGAHDVVTPEDEAADRWAYQLRASFLIEYFDLGEGYAVAQIPTPEAWVGIPLSELHLRSKHNVTIIAVKCPRVQQENGHEGADAKAKTIGLSSIRITKLPQPDMSLNPSDRLVIAGFNKDIKNLPQ